MTTMLDAKGPDYVTTWPGRIAVQIGCPSTLVLDAAEVWSPTGLVADLTPELARAAVATAETRWLDKRIARGDLIEDVTKCRGCGLRLPAPYGDCRECQ